MTRAWRTRKNNQWSSFLNAGSPQGNPPQAAFAYTVLDTTINLDASASTGGDGTVTQYIWNYGDGFTGNGKQVSYQYISSGTYTITLTVINDSNLSDSQTLVVNISAAAQPGSPAPTVDFSPVQNNLSFTVTANTTGAINAYAWDFGDNAKATTKTASHTYAGPGLYAVTCTVTSTDNQTATTTHQVAATAPNATPAPTPTPATAAKSPWTTGSVTEGMASGAPVYKASSLAGGASVLELQTLINNMPGNGYIDVSNEQIFMSSFSNSTYPQAAGGSKFYGLIGGISNGAFNNQITLRANAMTAAQVSAIVAQQSGTSQAAIIRTAASGSNAYALPVYMMGVHFVGADQPQMTDGSGAQFPTTPARMKGIDLDLSPNGSIMQNCLLEGFGASNGSTPPFEVGSIDYRRTTGMIMRRTEVSGILPVGSPSRPTSSTADPYGRSWRRTGGIQWNADKSPQMTSVSLHDTLVSGLTLSIASTSNNGSNNTENPTFNYVYVENNSQHGFSGINLENVIGPIRFNYGTFLMPGTGGYHVSFVNSAGFGTLVNNIPTDQFVINEPTWGGLGYNGLFTLRVYRYGQVNQTSPPKVIKNGVSLTPTTTPSASGVSPSTHYYLVVTN